MARRGTRNDARRADVHATRDRVTLADLRRERRRHCDYTAAQLARGTDDEGRFIGPRDVTQGLAFFWSSRSPA